MSKNNSWNKTVPINVASGGTGVNTLTGYASANGTNPFVGRTLTAGEGIAFTNATGVSGNSTVSYSGNFVFVSSQTANDSATIDFTGLTERSYLLDFNRVILATTGQSLIMQYTIDGINWNTANYNSGLESWLSYNSATVTNTNVTTHIILSDPMTNTEPCSGNFVLKRTSFGTGRGRSVTINGGSISKALSMFYATTAVNIAGLRLLSTSGNITSGVFSLYYLYPF